MSWSLGHIALLRSYPPLSRNMIYKHCAALRLEQDFVVRTFETDNQDEKLVCLWSQQYVSLHRRKHRTWSSLFDCQKSRALGRVIKIVVVGISGK